MAEPLEASWVRDDSMDGWALRDQNGKEYGFMGDEYALGHPDRGVHRLEKQIVGSYNINQMLRGEQTDD